ncbi:MAG: helix-turn-helix transcriptional regulator [Clostridia bacterium]|nr:helix-turn-helix transcriptional regulator [Clostridia bacterium]
MAKTMGEIIKTLRKERGITQETLAELLRVTPQAVSKWENNTGMPDISQIVPLANVFGVSTDVLFGLAETQNETEIKSIISDAFGEFSFPREQEQHTRCYEKLTEGLKKYPNTPLLLINALELGIALAYPENDCYDAKNSERIYKECIRNADILISVSKNPTDILRTHMIMVMLHASHGNKEAAAEHAKNFPWRADMTSHQMEAAIAHFEKKYANEQFFRQRDFIYHMEAVLNDLVQYARAFCHDQKYDEAIYIYEKMLSLIEWFTSEETIVPSLHCREWGDIYVPMATLYLNKGDPDKAIAALTKMVDYDIDMRNRFTEMTPPKHNSLLFQGTTFPGYYRKKDRKEKLILKLTSPSLAPLHNDDRYQTLLERAKELKN